MEVLDLSKGPGLFNSRKWKIFHLPQIKPRYCIFLSQISETEILIAKGFAEKKNLSSAYFFDTNNKTVEEVISDDNEFRFSGHVYNPVYMTAQGTVVGVSYWSGSKYNLVRFTRQNCQFTILEDLN